MNHKMKEVLVYVFAAMALVDGQVVSQGKCPKANVVKDFDANRYLGQWHEVYRYENGRQNGAECGISTYKYPDKGNYMELYHVDILNNDLLMVEGTISVDDDANGTAKLTFVSKDGSWKMPYWILNTDYKRHSLVYSCIELEDENKLVFSWLLGRSLILSATSIIDMDPDVQATELIWKNYRVTNQSTELCDDWART